MRAKAHARREKWPLWLSLSLAELTANRTFTLSFILNLTLGLIGLSTLDTFKVAVERQVASRSQNALGADLVISGSRVITHEEVQKIREALPASSSLRWEDSLLSMIATPDGSASRLVELRAIDTDYPFYASVRLRKQGAILQKSEKDIVREPHVWLPHDLLLQLGTQVGSSLKIGNKTFVISDVVEQDPQAGAQGFAMAPKVFIGRPFLEDTGLLGFGTRRWQSLLVKLPPRHPTTQAVKDLRQALQSPDLSIKTHEGAASDLNRVVAYLSDYLGLVALVALFLAGVGGIYLFQGHLTRRASDMAILMSLGMPLRKIMLLYVAQLSILALIAMMITGVTTAFSLPYLPRLLSGLLPPDLIVEPSLSSLFVLSLTAVMANLFACAPLLLRLRAMKPSMLFQESSQVARLGGMKPSHLLTWLPALGFYLGLSVWQSHSLKVGSLFVAFIGISGLILAAFATLLTRFALKVRTVAPLPLEMACSRLGRQKTQSLTTIAAIGLGTLLLTLVPLLERLLQDGLKAPSAAQIPALFLLDIQEEQTAPLRSMVEATSGAKLGPLAPLIRARLLEVNNQPLSKAKGNTESYAMREDEEAERSLNRGFNLSFRDTDSDSSQIVEGRPFSGRFTESPGTLPEISLEVRFAERMRVKVGDTLKFEVQGVPIAGQIISLRRVQWTSFQPNFFIEFQPGVLDDAPKSWIGAIAVSSPSAKNALQKDLVLSFPNVTAIDVTNVMERLLSTAAQMSLALKLMAILTLLAGMGVLLAIARTESVKRESDVVLLKTLGLGFRDLRLMTALEFGLLGFISSLIGTGLALLGTALFAKEVFESVGILDYRVPFVVTPTVTLLCTLIGVLATERSLRVTPQSALGRKSFNM